MGKDVLFSEWLNEQLVRERMTQADLAKAAGLSTGTISNLLSSKNKRSNPETYEKIAGALKMDKMTVLRAANWTTVVPDYPEQFDLNMFVGQLTDQDRLIVLLISKALFESHKKGPTSVK
jgi:transcriptional regulator with XRE-family HTH domain